MTSCLSERMNQAADVLEEAAKVYGAEYYPAEYSWTATELRREAVHVEAGEDDRALDG